MYHSIRFMIDIFSGVVCCCWMMCVLVCDVLFFTSHLLFLLKFYFYLVFADQHHHHSQSCIFSLNLCLFVFGILTDLSLFVCKMRSILANYVVRVQDLNIYKCTHTAQPSRNKYKKNIFMFFNDIISTRHGI